MDRAQLSKDALGGNVALQDVKLDVLSNLKANVIHAAVTSLSAKEREVVLHNGSRIRFDKAMLATGGKPKRLSIPGAERARTIRHTADVRRILEIATPGTEAVIVGTGFIGLDAASALVQRGLRVTVVERGRCHLPGSSEWRWRRR